MSMMVKRDPGEKRETPFFASIPNNRVTWAVAGRVSISQKGEAVCDGGS
jgi:hypothetical protein